MDADSNQTEQDRVRQLNDVHARLALNAAGLGLWEWSVEPDAVCINARLADILGRPELADGPFPASVLIKLTHVDDRDAVAQTLKACQESEDGGFLVEHRIHRPDGSERWLWISASAVERNEAGQVQKIVGVVQDRTDEKLAELKLAEEKLRNDLALSGSFIAIWEWDIDSNQVRWSSYLSDILGLPSERLSGGRDYLNDRIHPDDRQQARHATDEHLKKGLPYDVEFRLRHESGHYVTVRSRGQAKRDDTGRVIRVAGSLVDVTKEKESDAALRRIGLRSKLAVDAAQLATWELDLASETAVMDARLCDLLGRPELTDKPIPSMSMLDFTAPEDRDIVRGLFTALIKGESEFVRNEHRVLNAKGERIWIYAHVGVSERSADGKSLRLVGVTQDLREQKATEKALRDAKEHAEAASEAKSTFLATMSHEIRTPLNGMLGVAQLLGLSDLDESQRRYVDTLQSSGNNLATVIEDILDISRIEAGKLRLTPKRVETKAWLEDTLATFMPLADQKGLSLESKVDPDAAVARYFDPVRVAQVVGNLVSNAIKFTEVGRVSLTVTCPTPNVLRLDVVDTGIGIEPEAQEHIFERFTQADMSASREYGGSGLGLAIVNELVKLAGGEVGLDSKPGQGARFWFEIPAPPMMNDTGASSPPLPASGAPMRILVVEDNAVNRDMLAEMLLQHAFTPVGVASGEAALERLRTDRFDLVLLDLHMPGMGGFETLDEIRSGPPHSANLPVFLVSADATPDARDEADALGANGFFTKPVDMAELINAIRALSVQAKAQ